eukprot:13383762-Alexandrium_andersonii.AAC.1
MLRTVSHIKAVVPLAVGIFCPPLGLGQLPCAQQPCFPHRSSLDAGRLALDTAYMAVCRADNMLQPKA